MVWCVISCHPEQMTHLAQENCYTSIVFAMSRIDHVALFLVYICPINAISYISHRSLTWLALSSFKLLVIELLYYKCYGGRRRPLSPRTNDSFDTGTLLYIYWMFELNGFFINASWKHIDWACGLFSGSFPSITTFNYIRVWHDYLRQVENYLSINCCVLVSMLYNKIHHATNCCIISVMVGYVIPYHFGQTYAYWLGEHGVYSTAPPSPPRALTIRQLSLCQAIEKRNFEM